MLRTTVFLLLAVIVVVVAAGGPTAAFTSGSFARGSTTAVATDGNGLLGLDVAGSVRAGSSNRLVTVTNQRDQSLDVDVVSSSASTSLSNAQATLAPGESLVTSATVSCDSSPADVTVTVAGVAGSQFSGTATRTSTVDTSDCPSSKAPLAAVSGSAVAGTFSGPSGSADGSVRFDIRNTQSAPLTITDFELVTAGNATELGFDRPGKPGVDNEPGKDEVVIDASGGDTASTGAAEDNGSPFTVGENTSYPLNRQVTIEDTETAQVSLYQFTQNGSPYTLQRGDEVTVAVTILVGGESQTVTVTVTV